MKKLLVLSLTLLSVLCFAAWAQAETLTSGDYSYQLLDDGTAIITKYLTDGP